MKHENLIIEWTNGSVIQAARKYKIKGKTYKHWGEVKFPRWLDHIEYRVANYRYVRIMKHKTSNIFSVQTKKSFDMGSEWTPVTGWVKAEIV